MVVKTKAETDLLRRAGNVFDPQEVLFARLDPAECDSVSAERRQFVRELRELCLKRLQ